MKMVKLIGPFLPNERQEMRECLIPFLKNRIKVEFRKEKNEKNRTVYYLWREARGMKDSRNRLDEYRTRGGPKVANGKI